VSEVRFANCISTLLLCPIVNRQFSGFVRRMEDMLVPARKTFEDASGGQARPLACVGNASTDRIHSKPTTPCAQLRLRVPAPAPGDEGDGSGPGGSFRDLAPSERRVMRDMLEGLGLLDQKEQPRLSDAAPRPPHAGRASNDRREPPLP